MSEILNQDWSDVTSAKELKDLMKSLDEEDKDTLKARVPEITTEEWATYFDNEEYAAKFAEIKASREAKKTAKDVKKAGKKAGKRAGKKAKRFGKKLGKKSGGK